jgi:proteic killer suppression protein
MPQSFKDSGAEDVFNGKRSRAALKTHPETLWKIAFQKLDQLDSAATLDDLRIPPDNRFEKLSGDRSGQHSIRINQQYRIAFIWTSQGPTNVEIVDYH